ncbi:hypothetical protein ACLB2K_003978 [Fragaria x ananassa]
MVFKLKRDENEQLTKFEARLVVKGFGQKEGVDDATGFHLFLSNNAVGSSSSSKSESVLHQAHDSSATKQISAPNPNVNSVSLIM